MEEDLVTQSRRDQLRHLPHVGAAWAWFRHYDAPTYWVAPLVGLSEQVYLFPLINPLDQWHPCFELHHTQTDKAQHAGI